MLLLLVATAALAQDFSISTLTANNAVVAEAISLVGDDRGGIAVSGSQVFLTGDAATARFNRDTLGSGASLGVTRDGLVANLASSTVYLLGDGLAALPVGGGTLSSLIELNGATGVPNGTVVRLSYPITLTGNSSSVGIFSGWNRIVVHTGSRAYRVSLPDGEVADLGAMPTPTHTATESWAYWGVAENVGADTYIVYVANNTTISRTRVPSGPTTTVATFANLSDMASFTVSVSQNRWYFHHEIASQFAALQETLGYADATFLTPAVPPTITVQPTAVSVIKGEAATLSFSASGPGPLTYQWYKDVGAGPVAIVGATASTFSIGVTTLADAGNYSVVVANNTGNATSSAAALTVTSLDADFFQIDRLTANNAVVVDAGSLVGDDRGGLAVSGSQVFLTGDNSTARFDRDTLGSGASLGVIRDGLVANLATSTVYLLGNGSTPLPDGGGMLNSLIELNGATGLPSGNVISLSTNIPVAGIGGTVGIFSGWNRLVLHTGSRAYRVVLPAGTVTDMGAMAAPTHSATESWAHWGVAESVGADTYIVCIANSTTVARTQVPGGPTTTVATFANMSDMASFTLSVAQNRWYFHHEGSSQFGAFNEALGYADAAFLTRPVNVPPTVTLRGNITVPEDSGPYAGGAGFATFVAGPESELAQTLLGHTVTVVPAGLLSGVGINNAGTLNFTPVADANGLATVTVVSQDSGGTDYGGVDKTTNSFTITVMAVNDAPAFAINTGLLSGGGLQTNLVGWGNQVVSSFVGPSPAFTKLSAGGAHVLALKPDGTVVAWGDNRFGQATVPAGLSGVAAVAAGGSHSLALLGSGTVVAWGDNSSLQANVPAGLSGVTAIAAGGNQYEGDGHSLALKSDGTVVAWGNNRFGQATVPEGLSGVIAIAAGGSHSLALLSGGTVVAWGNPGGATLVPAGLSGVTAVAAGFNHSLALLGNGTVVAWGTPGAPTFVPNLSGVTAIAAGYDHNLALLGNGMVVAWGGTDGHGQTTVPDGLSGVSAIAASGSYVSGVWGTSYSLALKNDGTVVGWGYNGYGQTTSPTSLTGVTAIATGGDAGNVSSFGLGPAVPGYGHNLVLRSDGTVVAWGDNSYGQATVPAGLIGVSAIAAGYYHSLALKNDGTVVAWGRNNEGQISIPAGLSGVTAIAAAGDWSSGRSLALKNNGTVVAWGISGYDQASVPADLSGVTAIAAGHRHDLALLGNGTVVTWGDPSHIIPGGLSGVTAIAAGYDHSLALLGNGTVVAWGRGEAAFVPESLSGVAAIAAGSKHNLALLSNGTVVAWGAAEAGQIAAPPGLSRVTAVAAGVFRSLALYTTVTLTVMEGSEAQILANFATSILPGPPNELSQAVTFTVTTTDDTLFEVAPYIDGTATLTSGTLRFTPKANANGSATVTVYARDSGGAQSSAPQTFTITVTTVNDAPVLTAIGVSGTEDTALTFSVANFTGAYSDVEGTPLASLTVVTLPTTGTLKLSGMDVTAGQVILAADLGTLTYVPAANEHGAKTFTVAASDGTASSALATVTMTLAAVNDAPSFALVAGFNLKAWGYNFWGQLGDGTTETRTSPVAVGTATDWQAVAAGGLHSMALKQNGTLWAWGDNGQGQLGDGTSVDKTSPVQVGTAADWQAVAVGDYHTLAVKRGGTLWAWGHNLHGQLGDGSMMDKSSPVQIGTGTDWQSVAAGFYHSMAVKNDGTLWAWGDNSLGQLGDGTTVEKLGPVQVGTGTDWRSVTAGDAHTVAVKNDGTLWAWGYNERGGLGDGTTVPKSSPVQIGAATGWLTVAAGGLHTVAVKSDGTLWAWGYNLYGQLGDGTTVDKSSPVQIGSGTDWESVAVGYQHTVAVKRDGTLWAWGRNSSHGRLGDGTTVDKSSPVQIGAATDWRSVAAGSSHTLALAGSGSGSPYVLNALEDAGAQIVSGVASGISPGVPGEWQQTVSFTLTTDNDTLFAVGGGPAINAAGTLTFTPAAHANGSATVTVRAVDDSGLPGVDTSAAQTFTITVPAVNDEPSFIKGADQLVYPGDGAVSVASWATGISVGPADEVTAGQTLVFTVINGNNALFTAQPAVSPAGTLTYTPAPDAVGSVTVSVSAQDSGGTAYGGVDTSAVQTFTITFASAKVFVSSSPAVIAGSTVEVPISLAGFGTEGAVSFTLTYDRPKLIFQSAAVEAGSGLSLTWTEPYPDLTKVGVIVTKPAGTAFPAGTNVMLRMTFQAPAGTAPTTTPLGFSSTPVLQQVSDATANVLPNVLYVPGSVTILAVPPLEGDVSPRSGGSGAVTVSDAVQLTRFVAGWDSITDFTANGEFQRADSAPRATFGDGRVTLIDLVQTLRYAAGQDPATSAGGPTEPVAAALPQSRLPAAVGGRVVRVAGGNLIAGRANIASVQMDALGNEAGVQLSLGFDPAALTFVSATTGSGASGATVVANAQRASSGRVGLLLVMPAGSSITAGTRDLITLTFTVSGNGSTTVTVLNDTAASPREVADVNANPVGATYVGGTFNLVLPAGLRVAAMERAPDGSPRLLVGNTDGTPVTAAQAARYAVYVTSDLGGAWTLLPNALVLENGALKIVDPAANGAGLRFYHIVETP